MCSPRLGRAARAGLARVLAGPRVPIEAGDNRREGVSRSWVPFRPNAMARGLASEKVSINMFSYVVHGLGIHSELPLPELLADETAPPDIIIRRGAVDQRSAQGAATGSVWTAGPDEVCYHRAGVGSCLIRGGRRIIVDAAAGRNKGRFII